MKQLVINFIILFSHSVRGQTMGGEYKQYSDQNYTITYPRSWKLNCDMTFIAEDSIATVYGRWNIKNEIKLTIFIDSIKENGRMDLFNEKVKYIIRDNRIFRKSIPKKEYNELQSLNKHSFSGSKGEGFSKFKEREQSMYFQRVIEYKCK